MEVLFEQDNEQTSIATLLLDAILRVGTENRSVSMIRRS